MLGDQHAPWLGVQSRRSLASSCFAHQQCHAKCILRSRKIEETSGRSPESCDLVGYCLQMLSIAVSIRVQFPSSLDFWVLIIDHVVTPDINAASTVAQKNLCLSDRSDFQKNVTFYIVVLILG